MSDVIAPGLVRDAFAYAVGTFYHGDYHPLWLGPKMRRWVGSASDRIDHAFAELVAARLEELGWQTETEVKVTKLLRKGFPQDYGDVDVLAWRDGSARILLIECKDVQYRKNESEIAEQISDFRGELKPNGRPDLLLKHLRRVAVIGAHAAEAAAYTKVIGGIIEGHLVFRNPVPMRYAETQLSQKIKSSVFDDLGAI